MSEIHIGIKRRILKPSILAFVLPVLILFTVYIIRGVFPFGDKMYIRMDFYHQYAPFLKEFCRHVLNGESLFYEWEFGLGTNYWAHFAYYLASPLNWLLVLVPGDFIVEAMNLLLILRAGVAGSAFVFFLKENRKENMAMAVFGIFYALSGYYLAYCCNVIWADGYALFPLVALGVLRIARGKSAKLYIVSMLICTFSNFYLAVMIGMCCVLWLVICLISGRKKSAKSVFIAIGKFIASTLLYVGMCGVILLPVAAALMNTPAGDSNFPEKTETYFAFYELFERMCLNTPVNLKGSDLPNIYASVFALAMLPVYFGNKSIRLKEKIVCGIVLLFLLASFNINTLDYIWHGLHFPNSFPARQSFFYIFLLLAMGYEAYVKRKRVSAPVLYISMPAMAVLTGVAWIFLGKDNDYHGTAVYLCTLLFILLYGILLILERELSAKAVAMVLLLACVAEAAIHTGVAGVDSVITRAPYLEDDKETQQLLAEIRPEDGTFYRIEEQDRRTVNDAAWDAYYGASYFSSTMPGGVKEWYDAFGMRNSSVSYSFEGATPLAATLLNVRYVLASEDAFYPGNTFTETELVTDEGEVIHCYENNLVLPLGYMVDAGLENAFLYNTGNPFVTMNDYGSAVLKESCSLFVPVTQYNELSLLNFDAGAGAEATMEGEDDKKRTALEVFAGENVFLYVSTYMDAIDVEFHNLETGETETRHYDDLKFKKIISLGVEDYDRNVVVTPADSDVEEVKFYSYRMNEDVLGQIYEVLSEQPMELQAFGDRFFQGNVSVKEDGVLLLSVPYDEGWTVMADGVKAETFAWKDAFLALELEEGEHTLEFSYCPEGFREGFIISLISVSIALAISGCSVYQKKHKKTCE